MRLRQTVLGGGLMYAAIVGVMLLAGPTAKVFADEPLLEGDGAEPKKEIVGGKASNIGGQFACDCTDPEGSCFCILIRT